MGRQKRHSIQLVDLTIDDVLLLSRCVSDNRKQVTGQTRVSGRVVRQVTQQLEAAWRAHVNRFKPV